MKLPARERSGVTVVKVPLILSYETCTREGARFSCRP
jgi:hypothetical protein